MLHCVSNILSQFCKTEETDSFVLYKIPVQTQEISEDLWINCSMSTSVQQHTLKILTYITDETFILEHASEQMHSLKYLSRVMCEKTGP